MKKEVYKLNAPFPWFGGKRKVANIVWNYFGDVPNYVEPFAGSLATLLNRPHVPKIETVNDIDCNIVNFWRALKNAPEQVAECAYAPAYESNMRAIHRFLIKGKDELREKINTDINFYDAQIAGWWVWGISNWIGDGWTYERRIDSEKRMMLGRGNGVQSFVSRRKGKHKLHLYFEKLAKRLETVRVMCGDWKKVLTHAPTDFLGITGIFFDPPYAVDRVLVYTEDDLSISEKVRRYCIDNAGNPKMRIALCGYEEEHEMPDDWVKVEWKSGGFGSKNKESLGEVNRGKERIWFSPHCLQQKQRRNKFFT